MCSDDESPPYAAVAANGPLESARLFVAIASVALILFQGPKGQGPSPHHKYKESWMQRFLFNSFFHESYSSYDRRAMLIVVFTQYYAAKELQPPANARMHSTPTQFPKKRAYPDTTRTPEFCACLFFFSSSNLF